MRAVIGLGNPGEEYALSRHNVGFNVIDLYRDVLKGPSKGRLRCSSLVYDAGGLLLVKPLTYMNASGDAVRALVDTYRLDPKDLLVVYDELDLPLGRMRIVPGGGAGSHKGIRSIIERLGTEDIARVKIGIEDESRREDAVEFVLAPISPQEWGVLVDVMKRAVHAVDAFRDRPLDWIMTRFNTIAQQGPQVRSDGADRSDKPSVPPVSGC